MCSKNPKVKDNPCCIVPLFYFLFLFFFVSKKFFIKDKSVPEETRSVQKDAKTERTKKMRNKWKKKKKKPTKIQPQQKTQSTPTKPSITLHHSNLLAFAPSRTKTLSIIIDIAFKVMKISIPFNLRSGDWDS